MPEPQTKTNQLRSVILSGWPLDGINQQPEEVADVRDPTSGWKARLKDRIEIPIMAEQEEGLSAGPIKAEFYHTSED